MLYISTLNTRATKKYAATRATLALLANKQPDKYDTAVTIAVYNAVKRRISSTDLKKNLICSIFFNTACSASLPFILQSYDKKKIRVCCASV